MYIEEYDQRFLHEFILTFPLSPVATLLSGFLQYFGFPSPDAEEEEKARRAKRREATRKREMLAKQGEKGPVSVAEYDVMDEEGGKRQGGQDKDPFTVLVVRRSLLGSQPDP